MELQFNQRPFSQLIHKFQTISQRFIQAFQQDTSAVIENTSYILPIIQVEEALHDHYVTQEPLTITFEIYDHKAGMQLVTQKVKVLSPIQSNRTIELQPHGSKYSFFIDIDHILTLSRIDLSSLK